MKKVQEAYQQFQDEMGFNQIDEKNYGESREHLLYIYMLLSTEVAEVAEEFRKMFRKTDALVKEGIDPESAFEQGKGHVRDDLGKELADCLAYLCRLGNYFEFDLEKELYAKLDEIKRERKSN